MKSLLHFSAILMAATALLMFASRSDAQATQQGPLTALVNSAAYGSNFGPIERTEAASLDTAFAVDLAKFCPDGCFPNYLNTLYGRINALYVAVNQMVDPQTGLPSPNAPAIARQIAIGLRGIAPEELSAQRSASNEFASDQRDQIRSRIAELRNGAQGFAVNGFVPGALANNTTSLIGAASADPLPKDFSRWGGFLNGSYTHATRDVTALEDAFKITGAYVSLGVDYRLSYHTVIGAMLTHTNRSLTFDVTSSVAGGNIDSNGLAAVLYASYDWDGGYLSASVGQQKLSNDMRRAVRYDIPSAATPTNVVATGSSDSKAETATLDAGLLIQNGAFGLEPLFRALYRDTKFDAFTENSIDQATGLPSGLAMTFADRSTTTLNASVGMKFNYAFKPNFGALVPYLQTEFRHEFRDNVMATRANFADLISAGTTSPASALTLNSDRPDTSYYVVQAGASAVFKHGWQGFLDARQLFGLSDSHFLVVSLGLRGEF